MNFLTIFNNWLVRTCPNRHTKPKGNSIPALARIISRVGGLTNVSVCPPGWKEMPIAEYAKTIASAYYPGRKWRFEGSARAREDWNTCFPPSIHDQVPGKINLFTYFSTKTWFRVNSVSVSGVVKARSPHTNRPTPTPRRISIRQLRKGRHKPLKVYNLLRDVWITTKSYDPHVNREEK